MPRSSVRARRADPLPRDRPQGPQSRHLREPAARQPRRSAAARTSTSARGRAHPVAAARARDRPRRADERCSPRARRSRASSHVSDALVLSREHARHRARPPSSCMREALDAASGARPRPSPSTPAAATPTTRSPAATMNIDVGAHLVRRVRAARSTSSHPDVTVYVEVVQGARVRVRAARCAGPGGLPVGTVGQGRGAALRRASTRRWPRGGWSSAAPSWSACTSPARRRRADTSTRDVVRHRPTRSSRPRGIGRVYSVLFGDLQRRIIARVPARPARPALPPADAARRRGDRAPREARGRS